MFRKSLLALILCLGLVGCALGEGFVVRTPMDCAKELGGHCVVVCRAQMAEAVGFIAARPFDGVKCVCIRPGVERPVLAF